MGDPQLLDRWRSVPAFLGYQAYGTYGAYTKAIMNLNPNVSFIGSALLPLLPSALLVIAFVQTVL